MVRKTFAHENCSIARALEILGDGWTLMILREAFLGTRRFADFESHLGISKNVLSHRLQHLVDHGILETVDAGRHGSRFEYQLAPIGKDLITVLTALRQWGDRWIFGEGKEPLLVMDRQTGCPIERVRIRDRSGTPLHPRDLVLRPGPGASRETLRRFRTRAKSAPPSSNPPRRPDHEPES